MRLSKEEVRQVWDSDRKKQRKILILVLAVTAAVFLFSLCIRYNAYAFPDKFVPAKYLACLGTALKLLFFEITHNPQYAHKDEIIKSIGSIYYYGALSRLAITFMAFVAGAALAVSGGIFQTIYKNPMASPNILGATAGVNLGNLLMIVFYSSSALELVTLRYKYCYALTAICVVGVLILGRLAGDRMGNPSVMQMVMVGAVVSQGLNVLTMYFMYNLEETDLQAYQEMNLGTYLQITPVSLIVFTTVMAIALIPMLLLRYRFNVAALDASEAKSIGINAKPILLIAQVCGILMVTAAMIHCGEIGMVTMVVPYLVRKVVGADFRKVMIYSCLIGGILLMVCRIITTFIVIEDQPIPVTFIMNIILTPAFLLILARQRSTFNEA